MTTPDVPAVTGSSRLMLHHLHVRPDGDHGYVGRVDTGDFVMVPTAGIRAIHLLGRGLPVDEVARRLADQGHRADIADFASQLVALGYVATVDGHPAPSRQPQPPTLPRLRQHHVRWLLHPAVPLGVILLILTATAATVRRPSVLPGYHDLVWDRHTGLVLAVNAVVGWALVLAHETAHLATARAEGVPGRMSLSTRLQFLVVHTDVSGIWSAQRRVRISVYLSGIAADLSIAATGLLILALADPPTPVETAISLIVILVLATLPFEAMVFMRTDLYFLLQDLSRCPNLYGQGAAYLHYRLSRICRRHPANPIPAWTRRERRAVRSYAALLVVGTAGALLAFATVTLPATITMTTNAIHGLNASSITTVTDSIAVIIVIAGFQALWIRAWLRQHRPRQVARRRVRRQAPHHAT